MYDSDEVKLCMFIIGAIVIALFGIVIGLTIHEKDIRQQLCIQVYPNDINNYLQCLEKQSCITIKQIKIEKRYK